MGLVLALAMALSGCASISVQPGTEVDTKKAPEKVYVELFDTSKGEFNVDRDGAELAEFKTNLQQMMLVGTTVDLTKRLIPASAIHGDLEKPHQHAWLIRGEFVRVNQGSRLLRGAIGFGAGGTKLETNVFVYDLSDGLKQPFLTFSTTGGSNAEPGAITAIATDPLTIIVEAAASSGGGIAHGLTEDTARTAREITAELSDYMYHHGWITEDQWVKPKLDSTDLKPLNQ
jgi:Domain of unknown function (DUF4410)